MKESEQIVKMMEAYGIVPCGPGDDKCVNTFKKDGGRTCAIHQARVEVMSQAFWTVVILEEQGR